jgi:hypothetical protein
LTNHPIPSKFNDMSWCHRIAVILVTVALAALPARAEDPGYEVVMTVGRTAAGEPPTVSLSILPHAGYHLYADGPLLVRLRGEGVTPARPLYHREDAVDPGAEAPRFELPLHRDRAGAARLDAALTFYICRGARCRPVERSYGTSL